MKSLFFIFALSFMLHAITLDEIVFKALEKNPSLESINSRIKASEYTIQSSTKFSNPELLLTTNTLDSDEKMSQTTLTFKQKIPYYSKLDSKENLAIASKELLESSLLKAKVKLVYEIKISAYNIWSLQENYRKLNQHEKLTQQTVKLYETYSTTLQNQHMFIMDAELLLLDIKIQKSELEAELVSAYAQLSSLCAFEVDDLNISLIIPKLPTKEALKLGLSKNVDIYEKK